MSYLKTKKAFEKYLDETIEMADKHEYSSFIINELTQIKERVIIQRHYKGWEYEKINKALIHRFSLSIFLVREYYWQDEWSDRLWNILRGATEYEFYPES